MSGPNKFGLASSLREPRGDCDDYVCITCGDHAVSLRVVRVDELRTLALCEGEDGERSSVEIGLVDPVQVGDRLLVHAGTALQVLA